MTYNIYCFKCKKILESQSSKCPICGKKAKVLGTKIGIMATNGEYKAHL